MAELQVTVDLAIPSVTAEAELEDVTVAVDRRPVPIPSVKVEVVCPPGTILYLSPWFSAELEEDELEDAKVPVKVVFPSKWDYSLKA